MGPRVPVIDWLKPKDPAVRGGTAILQRSTSSRSLPGPRLCRLALAGLFAFLAGCGDPDSGPIAIQAPNYGPELATLEIDLSRDLLEGTLSLHLDGSDVTGYAEVWSGGARLALPIDTGPHLLLVRGEFMEGTSSVSRSQIELFLTPPPFPEVAVATPTSGSIDVPVTDWIHLEFAGDLGAAARDAVSLQCDGVAHPIDVHVFGSRELVINPKGELPAAAQCRLSWRAEGGTRDLAFRTAGTGLPAFVNYNRTSSRATAPFPDDFWLRPDPQRPGEVRLQIELSGFEQPDQIFFDSFVSDTRGLDGFSPIAHLTIELSEPPDPQSLPHTPIESMDPMASVGLFDVNSRSPTFGSRLPFRLEARSGTLGGRSTHALLIYPSVPLRPGGTYGIVITRRVRAAAARPFGPSLFFQYARDTEEMPGEPEALTRVRRLAGDVLDAVERYADPPIPREDVALAVRFTIRTTDGIPSDLLAMREDVAQRPSPEIRIERVVAEDPAARAAGSRVAAVVVGTFEAPDWRDENLNLARDPETGRPLRTGTRPVRFIAALPDAAFDGPVPVTLYQHGNPGSAEEEVLVQARSGLAEVGLAVVGFTDTINREVSPPGPSHEQRAQTQLVDILLRVLLHGRVPDYFVQTGGEQLAFLRAMGELGEYEQFEFTAAEGGEVRVIHGIDPTLPITYLGISEGANLAPAFLPYAPEIRAAALVVGGRRFSEVLIHQQADEFMAQIDQMGFTGLTATDVWVALALFQAIFDNQDAHNHAPFLYRNPLPINGDSHRASVLLVEGIDDSMIPNHATESLAWALGPLPVVDPARPVLLLPAVAGPLRGNFGASTTAGLVQFVPEGVDGIAPTAGCAYGRLSERSAREGHYCAQRAEEALRQRALFLRSAVDDAAPTIIAPLSQSY